MAKRFKKAGGPAPRRAVQNMLRNFDARNRAECRFIDPDEIRKQQRKLIQRDYPDLTPSEVELRVERRMEHGKRRH